MKIALPHGQPEVGKGTYLAPTSTLIGDVILGENCSVWFNAVIRGDVMPIRIGSETNIQDGSVIHGTYKKCGTTIGDRTTVGHGVILHGCEIGSRVLIGMGSIIMDKAKVSDDSIVAAGTLITEDKEFPPGVLIMGRPAVVKRALTDDEKSFLNKSADNYLNYKKWYEDGAAKIIKNESVVAIESSLKNEGESL